MSAINPSLTAGARAGPAENVEGLAAPKRGGKKNKSASPFDALFASILSRASESLKAAAPRGAIAPRVGVAPSGSAAKAADGVAAEALAAGTQAKAGSASATRKAPTAANPGSGGLAQSAAAGGQGRRKAETAPNNNGALADAKAAADAASGREAKRAVKPGSVEAAGLASSPLAGRAKGTDGQGLASPAGAPGAGSRKAGEVVGDLDAPISKRSGEARTSVLDLRRSSQARGKGASPGAEAAKAAETETQAREEPSAVKKEVVRELGIGRPDSGSGERPAKAQASEAAPSSDFSSMLAQRLRETGNGEIVQAARIVLKDGDSGTIRLRLKPESLGEVKIELNLSDKSISGKIVVESEEAKSAFERNMAELSDAFRQGGFETASLDVSVGSGSGGNAGGKGEGDSSPFFSERLRTASAASAQAVAGAYARRGGAVDILA